MTGTAVLIRHGQSQWNAQNRFTGWRDIALTPQGREEAGNSAKQIAKLNLHFDAAFTSALSRAQETCSIVLAELGETKTPTFSNKALNERDYGDLTGLNKDEARKRFGEDQVHLWRRGFTQAPPGGESLRDTAGRVLPFYKKHILPRLKKGETILVSAHGNSLRALIMHLDALTPEEVTDLNIATGEICAYHLTDKGCITKRERY